MNLSEVVDWFMSGMLRLVVGMFQEGVLRSDEVL